MTTANVPYDKERFVAAVLQGMGWEPTPFRMNLMREWISGERTGAGYNPLATTQEGGEDPSDPFWNDNGGNPVKNYRDFDTGVQQTIRTLSNQYYPALRATFETEQIQPGAAENAATWGTMHLANVLSNGGVSANGEGYSGAPQSSYEPADMGLDDKEYLVKYTRFRMLQSQLFDPMSPNADFPYKQDADPTLLQELFTLEAELNDYAEKKSQGAQDYQDYLDRLDWGNKNDPRIIDATNTANAWARQNNLNQQAASATQQDMVEQRSQQNDAETSSANWKASSAFGSPMGFRVPSTNLPDEDAVYAKNIARISKNLPEVTPLPYATAPAPRTAAPKPTTPSVIPSGAGTNPVGTVTGSRGLDDDPFASRPLSTAPPLAPSSASRSPIPSFPVPNASSLRDLFPNPFAAAYGEAPPGQIPPEQLSTTPQPLNPLGLPSAAQLGAPFQNPYIKPRTTPSQPSPLTNVQASVRRFVGSIFGGR